MEDESSYTWGMDIDGRWPSWEQIGNENLLYANSDYFAEEKDCTNPPQQPEEFSLHWQDGSVTKIQMYRPPDWQPVMDGGKAEEFYIAIQEVLQEFLAEVAAPGLRPERTSWAICTLSRSMYPSASRRVYSLTSSYAAPQHVGPLPRPERPHRRQCRAAQGRFMQDRASELPRIRFMSSSAVPQLARAADSAYCRIAIILPE